MLEDRGQWGTTAQRKEGANVVVVMAGTTEGLELARALARDGHRIAVTVVTEAGAVRFRHAGFTVFVGALDGPHLCTLLQTIGAHVLVDATHPYAQEAHRSAQWATDAAGIALVRYQRPGLMLESSPQIHWARDHEAAAHVAKTLGGPVFLTTGTKNLGTYANVFGTAVPFFVRLLPTVQNLEQCRHWRISADQIYALKGPFSQDLNRCLFNVTQAKVLVTKDSREQDGEDKILPAIELGMEVVVVNRPTDGSVRPTHGAVVSQLKDVLSSVRTYASENHL